MGLYVIVLGPWFHQNWGYIIGRHVMCAEGTTAQPFLCIAGLQYHMSFVRETTNVYSSSFYFLLNIYILQLDWPVNSYASLGGPNILDDVVRGDILSNSQCKMKSKYNQSKIDLCYFVDLSKKMYQTLQNVFHHIFE